MSLVINALGAVSTGIALTIILMAKFMEGAWITVLVIPATMILFLGVKRHYEYVARRIRCPSPPEREAALRSSER